METTPDGYLRSEEQEQIAELKACGKFMETGWSTRRRSLPWLRLLGKGGIGTSGNQSGQASMIYGVLQKAVEEKDTQRIKAASGELIEKYSRTSYASLGALSSAKAMVDAGDSQTAKAQLRR